MNKLNKKEVSNNMNSDIFDTLKNYGKYIAGGLLALTLFFGSYSVVSPGERGVLVTLGKPSPIVLDEGFHFKFPFVSDVKIISVRVQKTESTSEAATKDLQRITAKVALNWNLDPKTVNDMYRSVGDEHAISDRIINPAVSEVLKAATAKMTAEQVLTHRMELKKTIDEMLVARLTTYNIIVRDISLVNLDFTVEFNHAVEAKQIAEQQAKQAEYVTSKAIQEAKAEVNRARGEAESNLTRARAQAEGQKLLRQTLTKDILQLEYLKKWDGKLSTVAVGNSAGVILDLKSLTSEEEED